MVQVKDVARMLEAFAPAEMKMDFDNVGFLAGTGETEVTRVLTALDITDQVIDEAIESGAQLIVSHHPLFFSLKAVTDADPVGRRVVHLLRAGLSAICMHTNLDAAEGGVNDALADALGLENRQLLTVEGHMKDGTPYCIGREGWLARPVPLEEYLAFVTKTLNCGGLRYVPGGKPVHHVAVMGGAGGDDYQLALQKGCDTYVTADVKYHVFLECRAAGLNLIDAGHFNTENVVVTVLAARIQAEFPEISVQISSRHGQTEKYYC